MLKSRLQKLDGLIHIKLKENIENVISKIPKEKYRNIFTPFNISNADLKKIDLKISNKIK